MVCMGGGAGSGGGGGGGTNRRHDPFPWNDLPFLPFSRELPARVVCPNPLDRALPVLRLWDACVDPQVVQYDARADKRGSALEQDAQRAPQHTPRHDQDAECCKARQGKAWWHGGMAAR